jgi:hypothetical protein
MTPARNVFVLCTGRCGSTTFAKAAAHATNFTAAHEARTHLTGPARFAYPFNHVEVDNRLAWNLGRLDQAYGDDAHYVHLLRDPAQVAQSFVSRQNYGLIKAYRETILLNLVLRAPKTNKALIAADMIDTITSNITHFLRDKTKVMTVHLDSIDSDFPAFWHWIGATGDLTAAMGEWSVRHNATELP